MRSPKRVLTPKVAPSSLVMRGLMRRFLAVRTGVQVIPNDIGGERYDSNAEAGKQVAEHRAI